MTEKEKSNDTQLPSTTSPSPSTQQTLDDLFFNEIKQLEAVIDKADHVYNDEYVDHHKACGLDDKIRINFSMRNSPRNTPIPPWSIILDRAEKKETIYYEYKIVSEKTNNFQQPKQLFFSTHECMIAKSRYKYVFNISFIEPYINISVQYDDKNMYDKNMYNQWHTMSGEPHSPPLWYIQIGNGEVKTYFNKEEIISDIESGLITPDSYARSTESFFQQKDQNFDPKTWKLASQTLIPSKIYFQRLFSPIWTFSIAGASFGAQAGAILKSIDTLFLFHIPDNNIFDKAPDVNHQLFLISIIYILPLMWFFILPVFRRYQKYKKFAIQGLILFPILMILKGNADSFFREALFLIQIYPISMITGAILGCAPAMIIGTLIGWKFSKNTKKSPHSIPEGRNVYIKGIIYPLIVMAFIIPTYIWFNVTLNDYFEKHPTSITPMEPGRSG